MPTIEDLRADKAEFEGELQAAIADFEEKHGVLISWVGIDRDMESQTLNGVSIAVSLE